MKAVPAMLHRTTQVTAGLAIAAALLVAAGAGHAQVTTESGPEIGWVYTTFQYDDTPSNWDVSGKQGITVGGFFYFGIAGPLGFASGLRFTQRGATVAFDSTGTSAGTRGETDYTLNYIAAPALLKLDLPLGFYLLGGAEFGILIGATETTSLSEGPGSPSEKEEDITEAVEQANVWIDVGLGVSISMGRFKGYLQGRFSQGVVGTGEEAAGWPSDWKTQAFEVIAGFGWGSPWN